LIEPNGEAHLSLSMEESIADQAVKEKDTEDLRD
jgi:hypothetical protein